jgi:hypothetical protein
MTSGTSCPVLATLNSELLIVRALTIIDSWRFNTNAFVAGRGILSKDAHFATTFAKVVR